MSNSDLEHGDLRSRQRPWVVRVVSIVAGVGLSMLYCHAVAANFVAFLLSTFIGLALAAGTGWIATQPALSVAVAIAVALVSAGLAYAFIRSRGRDVGRGRWYVAAALGALTVLICSAGSLLYGFLLTSATIGNLATSDYERDVLVGEAAPTWAWWLLLLLVGFVGVTSVIAAGPPQAASGENRYRWSSFLGLIALPASSLGALVTTAMYSLR